MVLWPLHRDTPRPPERLLASSPSPRGSFKHPPLTHLFPTFFLLLTQACLRLHRKCRRQQSVKYGTSGFHIHTQHRQHKTTHNTLTHTIHNAHRAPTTPHTHTRLLLHPPFLPESLEEASCSSHTPNPLLPLLPQTFNPSHSAALSREHLLSCSCTSLKKTNGKSHKQQITSPPTCSENRSIRCAPPLPPTSAHLVGAPGWQPGPPSTGSSALQAQPFLPYQPRHSSQS